jgi:hypothetical protein
MYQDKSRRKRQSGPETTHQESHSAPPQLTDLEIQQAAAGIL